MWCSLEGWVSMGVRVCARAVCARCAVCGLVQVCGACACVREALYLFPFFPLTHNPRNACCILTQPRPTFGAADLTQLPAAAWTLSLLFPESSAVCYPSPLSRHAPRRPLPPAQRLSRTTSSAPLPPPSSSTCMYARSASKGNNESERHDRPTRVS